MNPTYYITWFFALAITAALVYHYRQSRILRERAIKDVREKIGLFIADVQFTEKYKKMTRRAKGKVNHELYKDYLDDISEGRRVLVRGSFVNQFGKLIRSGMTIWAALDELCD